MRSFCPWGQTFLHSGPPRPTTTSRSRELGKRAKRRISRSHILELRIRNQKASKKILNQLVSYFGIGNQKASKKKNFKPARLYFGTRNQELEKRAKRKTSNQQVSILELGIRNQKSEQKPKYQISRSHILPFFPFPALLAKTSRYYLQENIF